MTYFESSIKRNTKNFINLIMNSIVYESGEYYVLSVKTGYEVYKNGLTCATRCAQIGYKGEIGLQKAIQEINRRLSI